MQHRLIAGTINRYDPEEGWRNWHLDANPREFRRGVVDRGGTGVEHGPGGDDVLRTFRGGMFDEVRCHHVLEHMHTDQALSALANMRWMLKSDGILDVEVPDAQKVMSAWVRGELDWQGLQQWLYGEQLPGHSPYDSHRQAYSEERLREQLSETGFKPGGPLEAGHSARFRAMAA